MLMMTSEIADKDLIIRILEMYSDGEKREQEIKNLAATYKEIANELFISVDTVRHHIRNIYKKLHVHSRSEAVAKAIRKKIIWPAFYLHSNP